MKLWKNISFICIFLAYGSLFACVGGNEIANNKIESNNATIINLYMEDVANQIGKNYLIKGASDVTASQEALIAFTILPDGKITNIKFLIKSENAELDMAALKAINMASPTKPFPKGIEKPYLVMGLRFSLKGIK